MASALAITMVVLVTACATDANPPARPNVLLISIDTLRADHLASYGYPRATSTNIDRLAAEGTRFSTAWAASSWTIPSHMTMLTGLPPTLHGVDNVATRLDPARVTLAEHLRDAGWQTAAFVTGPTMHRAFGYDQGFDRYENTTAFTEADFDRGDPTLPSARARRRSHQAVTGPTIAADVTSWLATEARPPFFLFVHLWDPHYDYIPPAPWDTRFDPHWDSDFDFSNLELNKAIGPGMPADALAHLIALYDGEIGATDEIVGRITTAVEDAGWLDDTLLVITADHGEEFLEHGGKGHRWTLYEEMLHVPLIFRLPGVVRAGRVVDGVTASVHLLPTILGIVGLEPGPEATGRDLSDVLRGAPPPDDLWAFAELKRPPQPPLYAARVGRRKYLATTRDREGEPLTVRWFDLATDPGEQHLRKPDDDESRGFVEKFRAHVAALTLAADALPRQGAGPAGLSDETREQLRALGYL